MKVHNHMAEKILPQRTRLALVIAFSGIAILLIAGVVLANVFLTRATDSVTHILDDSLPTMLAVKGLSEQSAHMAVATPELIAAENNNTLKNVLHKQQQIGKAISHYLEIISSHLFAPEVELVIKSNQLRMHEIDAIGELVEQRIELHNTSNKILDDLLEIQADLSDNIPPIIYGINSLYNLNINRIEHRLIHSLKDLKSKKFMNE